PRSPTTASPTLSSSRPRSPRRAPKARSRPSSAASSPRLAEAPGRPALAARRHAAPEGSTKMSSKSMTNARAIVNVLAARLEGDHERSAKDWDTIRLQAAQLAGFAKRKRDEAAAMGEPEPTPNPSRGRSPSSDDAGREAPRKAIDELPMRVSAYYVSRGRGDHV